MTSAEYAAYLSRGHSRDPKPKSANNQAECEIHSDIAQECRRRGWLPFYGSMRHRTHRTIGEPDFVILCEDGKVLLVEVKTKNGKLTPEQNAVHAMAKRLGHEVHVVRSLDEFLEIIKTQ